MVQNRIYDGLGAAPVNRASVRALGKGVSYEPNIRLGQLHWKAPPRTRPVPQNVPDLTGKTFGRFTVIGWYGKTPSWIVKCACGDYENRRTNSLKRATSDTCCVICEHLIIIKRREKMPRKA